MPTTRQGHLLKRHRFDTGAAGRKRRAEARGTGGAFNLSPSRDRSNRSIVSRSSSSLPPFLQISTDLSKTSRLCIYIREIGNRGSDVIESEGRRNCRESKRTTGWRLAFAESCYSAARQEAFAHRIVFVEIKQRFLDGLVPTWWPDLVPFSLVYIEMFAGRGKRKRSYHSFPSLQEIRLSTNFHPR